MVISVFAAIALAASGSTSGHAATCSHLPLLTLVPAHAPLAEQVSRLWVQRLGSKPGPKPLECQLGVSDTESTRGASLDCGALKVAAQVPAGDSNAARDALAQQLVDHLVEAACHPGRHRGASEGAAPHGEVSSSNAAATELELGDLQKGVQDTAWGITRDHLRKLHPKAHEERHTWVDRTVVLGHPADVRYHFYRQGVLDSVQFVFGNSPQCAEVFADVEAKLEAVHGPSLSLNDFETQANYAAHGQEDPTKHAGRWFEKPIEIQNFGNCEEGGVGPILMLSNDHVANPDRH